MASPYKSKTMQALEAQRLDTARKFEQLVVKTARDFASAKEKLDQLTGERGTNPAIRRSDFVPLAKTTLEVSKHKLSISELPTPEQSMLLAIKKDLENLHATLEKITNIYGTQG